MPTVRRTRVTAVLALALALLLGGCSGGAEDEPSSTSSASPSSESSSSSPSPSSAASSAAASATPAVEQAPAVPKARRGKAGQRRFAQHVMAVWAYGLRTNKAAPLVSLSPPKKPCVGCKKYAAELAKRRRQRWSVDFPGVRVRRIELRRQETADGVPITYADARVDVPETDSFNADGSYRNTNAARPGASFEVIMRFTDKGYRLLAFTVS